MKIAESANIKASHIISGLKSNEYTVNAKPRGPEDGSTLKPHPMMSVPTTGKDKFKQVERVHSC